MSALPLEVLRQLFAFCTAQEFARAFLVPKTFRKALDHELVYRQIMSMLSHECIRTSSVRLVKPFPGLDYVSRSWGWRKTIVLETCDRLDWERLCDLLPAHRYLSKLMVKSLACGCETTRGCA
jgi:hypothetical protein